MKKNIIRIVLVVIIALFLELGVFNFQYFVSCFDTSKQYNIIYSLDDMNKINWENSNNKKLVSKVDANLIIEEINTYIDDVFIEYDSSKIIPDIVLFYTDKNNIYFNAENIITISNPQSSLRIGVNKTVKDLRIDLSDDEGIILNDIKIIVNPAKLDISISRILAIVLIYFSFISLFTLQRSPKYDL